MQAAALQEYLEEMELKIRYMKNDIEFKQNQIRSKNVPTVSNSSHKESLSSCRSVIKPHSQSKTVHSIIPDSTLAATKMNEHARKVTISSCPEVVHIYSKSEKHNPESVNIPRRSTCKSTTSGILPSSSVIPGSPKSSVSHVPNIANIPQRGSLVKVDSSHSALLETERLVCHPSTSRTVIPPLPKSCMKTERKSLVSSTSPALATLVSTSAPHEMTVISKAIHYGPQSKRTVSWSSKGTQVAPVLSSTTVTSGRKCEKMTFEPYSVKLSQAQCHSFQNAQSKHSYKDPYKYEAPLNDEALNKLSSVLMSNRYRVVRAPTASLSNTISSSNTVNSFVVDDYSSSSTNVQSIPTFSVTKITTPGKQKSVMWKPSQKKSPKLNIQTAAKVVGKYKLKWPSPTSTSNTPPSLFDGNPRSHALHMKNSKRSDTLNSLVSERKLDRRPVCSSTPKRTWKRNQERNNDIISKHKIDKRSNHQTGGHTHPSQPVIKSKLKLDKRFMQVGHDFEGRICQKETGMIAVYEHISASSNSNKQFNSPPVSSKYKWKKPAARSPVTDSLQACTVRQGTSKFKWSRKEVQTRNGEWHELKQKLRLLLSKKQRNLRWALRKKINPSYIPGNHYSIPWLRQDNTDLIKINGIMYYKSSYHKLLRARKVSGIFRVDTWKQAPAKKIPSAKNKLQSQKTKLISVRGSHFHIDHTGKKLSRTHTGSSYQSVKNSFEDSNDDSVHMKSGLVQKYLDDSTRLAASRAVNRSIAITAGKQRRNRLISKKKQHCIFFGRFGKCHRGNKCPFTHDPEKVAVCTRFLRGKCDVAACPFSHKASTHKMPVCMFYLRGSCSRENCPYLHVKVNPNAPVCKDFRNGFCALGEKCKKIHSHVCPSFAVTGICSRGAMCTMVHRMRKKETDALSSQVNSKIEVAEKKQQRDGHAVKISTISSLAACSTHVPPTAYSAEPSFISLLSSSGEMEKERQHQKQSKSSFKITPRFVTQCKYASGEKTESDKTSYEIAKNISVPSPEDVSEDEISAAKSQQGVSESYFIQKPFGLEILPLEDKMNETNTPHSGTVRQVDLLPDRNPRRRKEDSSILVETNETKENPTSVALTETTVASTQSKAIQIDRYFESGAALHSQGQIAHKNLHGSACTVTALMEFKDKFISGMLASGNNTHPTDLHIVQSEQGKSPTSHLKSEIIIQTFHPVHAGPIQNKCAGEAARRGSQVEIETLPVMCDQRVPPKEQLCSTTESICNKTPPEETRNVAGSKSESLYNIPPEDCHGQNTKIKAGHVLAFKRGKEQEQSSGTTLSADEPKPQMENKLKTDNTQQRCSRDQPELFHLHTDSSSVPSSLVTDTHSSQSFQTAEYIGLNALPEATETHQHQTGAVENEPVIKLEAATNSIFPLFIRHHKHL